jgi:hypothetical protein
MNRLLQLYKDDVALMLDLLNAGWDFACPDGCNETFLVIKQHVKYPMGEGEISYLPHEHSLKGGIGNLRSGDASNGWMASTEEDFITPENALILLNKRLSEILTGGEKK